MTLSQRVIWASFAGLVVGTICLLAGFVSAMLIGGPGSITSDPNWAVTSLYYLLGFTVGGAVVGLVWPQSGSPARRLLAFTIGMMCIMTVVIAIDEGPPNRWHVEHYLAILILGPFFGWAFYSGFSKYD
jgi:hypothetical protein